MPAKTFSIMGDSISTFEGCVPDGYTLFYNDERLERSGVLRPEDTWWSHAVRGLGGTVLADSAWSGSMVEGAGFPAASSPERAAALLGPDGQAPDAVLVFIGINDYGWGGAEAQAAGRSHAMPRCIDPATVPEQIASAAPADAAERFGAAYRTMLRGVLHNAAAWAHARRRSSRVLLPSARSPPGRIQCRHPRCGRSRRLPRSRRASVRSRLRLTRGHAPHESGHAPVRQHGGARDATGRRGNGNDGNGRRHRRGAARNRQPRA